MSKEEHQRMLEEILAINRSGYAGIMPNGNIVDRRKHPTAIPVLKNSMFGIPEPKPLPKEGTT